jgi:DNA ligase-1
LGSVAQSQPPAIQLANIYRGNVEIQNYLVSEKLDGIRGFWDGEKLISRQGNEINAPKWFTKNFPRQALDGELWIGREKFEQVSSVVRQKIPDDKKWQNVRFMIFDLPKSNSVFSQRFVEMKNLVASSNSKYLQLINQFEISDEKTLFLELEKITKNGGEGLMLHLKNSLYAAKRDDDLLKLKKFEDEEAVVIAHIAGSGKYKGLMGALLVENSDKIRFKIGSGFSDLQRQNPPKIGDKITYKFWGKTKNNLPRFAIFMRVRDEI